MSLTPLTPHGPGFSFVDAAEVVEPGRLVRASKYLDPALPFFADHFPGRPLMPGVLLIESGAQAAGILWANVRREGEERPHFALAQVAAFKLQRAVFPGQTISIQAELEREFGMLAQFAIEIREADEIVASGRLILALSAGPKDP